MKGSKEIMPDNGVQDSAYVGEAEKFEKYFSEYQKDLNDSLTAIDNVIKIAEDRVKDLGDSAKEHIRGVDKWLTDQMEALSSLYTERRSIIDDLTKIKQMSMDYAIKTSAGDGDDDELIAKFVAMNKHMAAAEKTMKKVDQNPQQLNEEISKKIEEATKKETE